MNREAERQQALLRVLHGLQPSEPVAGLAASAGRMAALEDGLRAYRAHARTTAERALAAAYPVLQQLVGAESFAALAWTLWQRQPPQRGDLAEFGAGLAGLVAGTAELAEERYLPDVARLEWAVHRAGRAADAPGPATGLALLAEADPASLRVVFAPGTALLCSRHPVVAIWQAHQAAEGAAEGRADRPVAGPAEGPVEGPAEGLAAPDELRFGPARAALAAGRGDAALVWRRGWRVAVERLEADHGRFTRHLMAGASLGRALERAHERAITSASGSASERAAGGGAARERPGESAGEGAGEGASNRAAEGPDFEAWLLRGLRDGWLAGFEPLAPTRWAAG